MMVLVGGYTRLNHAGLSIVQWKPVTGIFPPLCTSQWDHEFSLYQQSPEFQKVNFSMTLEDFKSIFWIEYIHRLMGRLLSLFFFLPGLYFMIKKAIPLKIIKQLAFISLLGCLQGVMGWYMVKSGLIDNPMVSPYRLATHLMLAILIYALLARTAFSLQSYSKASAPPLKHYGVLVLTLLTCTTFYGALVAGLKAGFIYNTFPLMEGTFLPPEAWYLRPVYRNFLENPTMVQFIHRMLALLTFCSLFLFYRMSRRFALPVTLKKAILFLLFGGVLQISLGITTLLLTVPKEIALAHQGSAILLFGLLTFILFHLSPKDDELKKKPF
jgi:cytochrome c oxidase assembly protein subunit 15